MSKKDRFEIEMQALGSWPQSERPPAKEGLSRRLIGVVGVDTATIRIGDPIADDNAAVLISTGGDGIYPVWGTYLDGELLEINMSASYFAAWETFGERVSDDDDLADLMEAQTKLDVDDQNALDPAEVKKAKQINDRIFGEAERMHHSNMNAIQEAQKALRDLP
jgi:hypothetical protein